MTRSLTSQVLTSLLAFLAASGGSACGAGDAGPPSAPAPLITVQVQPATAEVRPGQPVAFTALVSGTTNTPVEWAVTEASGGTIDSSGRYVAPQVSAQSTFHVVATSVASPSASATATVTVTPAAGGPISGLGPQLAVLAQRAIFFEHASVGSNVEEGLDRLLASVSGPKPTLRQAVSGTVGAGAIASALKPGVIFGNWFPSQNGHPFDKMRTFESLVTGGAGGPAQIAMMKLCFTDLPSGDAGATPANVFASYKAMMDRLRVSYPKVRFVHWTMPLTNDGASANGPREVFNDLVRSTYGATEPVFDLALIESTRPDGSRETAGGVPSIYPGFTADGGHLNKAGSDGVAAALVQLLANLE